MIFRPVICDRVDVKAGIGGGETFTFLENGQPAQACLIDLQDQTLEQNGFITNRKSIFGIMIGPVPFMSLCNIAVSRQRSCPL